MSVTQQRTRQLRIRRNESGQIEFEISLSIGSWWSMRRVTVIDEREDVNEIVREIIAHNTDVTNVSLFAGLIILNRNGRRVVVAQWEGDEWDNSVNDDRQIAVLVPTINPDNEETDAEVNPDAIEDGSVRFICDPTTDE